MPWAPDYVTTADLADYLRIDDIDDDPALALAVTAASRAIDHACSRQFGVTAATEERTFEACWSPRRGLYTARIDDVMTQVGMVVTIAGATTTNYALEPTNAAAEGRPWTRLAATAATWPTLGSGPPTILVEATWGWTTVPEPIRSATLLQASRYFADRNAPFGVAGSPDLGSEMRLLAKVHPDVETMIRPYRRDWPRL